MRPQEQHGGLFPNRGPRGCCEARRWSALLKHLRLTSECSTWPGLPCVSLAVFLKCARYDVRVAISLSKALQSLKCKHINKDGRRWEGRSLKDSAGSHQKYKRINLWVHCMYVTEHVRVGCWIPRSPSRPPRKAQSTAA